MIFKKIKNVAEKGKSGACYHHGYGPWQLYVTILVLLLCMSIIMSIIISKVVNETTQHNTTIFYVSGKPNPWTWL